MPPCPPGSAGDSVACLLLTLSVARPLCHRNGTAGLTLPRNKPNPGPRPPPGVGNGAGKSQRRPPTCPPRWSRTRPSVPLPEQELGSQEEVWPKALGGLCQPCPAGLTASSQGKVLHPPPVTRAGVRGSSIPLRLQAERRGALPSPGAVGTPPGAGTAGVPGVGTTGMAGACAQEGGELTGLIFSRLRSALTCDPRYRKDAASASSPGAGWLDLVGRGKSTSRLFRPAGVASNSNLISP